MSYAYLDSSAFVKLFAEEAESEHLHAWLPQWPLRASCGLLRTEAVRALRPHGLEHVARARAALGAIRLVSLDDRLLDGAGDLSPQCRSLDAIHLAAAQALGPELGVVVTYDARMAAAAAALGFPVATP